MTIPATPSFPFDRIVAEREGWGLAEAGFHTDGTPIMELQAIQDGHPALADDQAAWGHVVGPVLGKAPTCIAPRSPPWTTWSGR